MSTRLSQIPKDYPELLQTLKERIRSAQVRAATSVNRELVLLYWQIGREILARQHRKGWGAKVIDQLATDLGKAFPDMRGFSSRNLKYMRALAEAWPNEQFVQQAVAQIPWGHNVRILDTLQEPEERAWYIRQTIEYGWSRSVLLYQIESKLYHRQGKALTNFEQTLPAPQSELAQELLKDPYNFDFLSLSADVQERELHHGLIHHLRDFLASDDSE
jgi:predicted nuclease of restriction endonuclease-like (RecB) superfamily